MTDTDLSDEARNEWCKRFTSSIRLSVAQNTWSECKRRAELKIAELQAQAEARELKAASHFWTVAFDRYAGLLISHGVTDWSAGFDEAYRAYREKEGA